MKERYSSIILCKRKKLFLQAGKHDAHDVSDLIISPRGHNNVGECTTMSTMFGWIQEF